MTLHVSFLVPHPERMAVMAADPLSAANTPALLPTVSLPDDEPRVPEMLAAVGVLDPDTTVVLRTAMTAESVLLVECDAIGATLAAGWTWSSERCTKCRPTKHSYRR